MRQARFVTMMVALVGCGGGELVMQAPDRPDGGEAADLVTPFEPADAGDVTPDDTPDGAAPAVQDMAGTDQSASVGIVVGGMARVTAGALNLRTGPGTSNSIITAMPCGAEVKVVGGPTTGWWNVTYQNQTGWASGTYLVPSAQFDPSVCPKADGGVDAGSADGGGLPTEVTAIFARARLGVGFSYWWGHGAWRSDGAQHGSCLGSCPNCTHSGSYGADCSGFVAKCWQIPKPSPIEQDLHPYSTYNFFNQTTHWSQVPRSKIQAADALVYNANGSGHIVLFESGRDPWGSVWLYEARGCSYGIQHNLRTIASQYIAIRREGL